jgi:hypothetical protein
LLEVLAVPQGILDLECGERSLALASAESAAELNWIHIPSLGLALNGVYPLNLHLNPIHQMHHSTTKRQDRDNPKGDRISYPEINLKVSTSSKLPISNLEGNGHHIIAVQGLVEAFS